MSLGFSQRWQHKDHTALFKNGKKFNVKTSCYYYCEVLVLASSSKVKFDNHLAFEVVNSKYYSHFRHWIVFFSNFWIVCGEIKCIFPQSIIFWRDIPSLFSRRHLSYLPQNPKIKVQNQLTYLDKNNSAPLIKKRNTHESGLEEKSDFFFSLETRKYQD